MPDDDLEAGGRARAQVDGVGDMAALEEAFDDPDRLIGDGLLRLVGGGADVMRAVDARQLSDRIGERAAPALGLIEEDVETDAQTPLEDRAAERVRLAELAARGVEED